MPIYTRTGDKGSTRIYGTRDRVSKTDSRFGALGTIDELNSQLGLVSSICSDRGTKSRIARIQQDLFEISSEIATAPGAKLPFKFRKAPAARLERWIDEYWKQLAPLANFIFPGGSISASHAHVARTVARRAERMVVEFSQEQDVNPNILGYINRLSDFLLALARYLNKIEGVKDIVWSGSKKK